MAPDVAGQVPCATCGALLTTADRFCGVCGTPVGGTPPATAPEQGTWTGVLDRLRRATAGEFEILRELGRGGMAAVYLAHELALDRRVAIKVMSPALLEDRALRERFRQEAVTVANLAHPNIVTVHAVRQVDELQFFVMQLVEGRGLDAILTDGGVLPLRTIRSLLHQVGSALAFAHRRGVVHRDVKPANILVNANGDAIVTDFGIAKVMEQQGHTQTGSTVGTPPYMSPEQCLADVIGPASDQYSLGIVAYELLTGVTPYRGSQFAVMKGHIEGVPEPIAAQRPDCPPELEQAVLRMLAKTPAERFAGLPAALQALGAQPLPDEDPERARLAALARSGLQTTQAYQTPRSPAPASRAPRGAAPEPRPTVARLEVTPASAQATVGDTTAFRAVALDARGRPLTGRGVRWSSADERVAVVGTDGVATARAPGTVALTATCDDRTATATLTVVAAPVGSVAVSPPPRQLVVARPFRLHATVLDVHGTALDRAVQWRSSDESVATVDAQGTVTPRRAGRATVSAACEGLEGAVELVVPPPAGDGAPTPGGSRRGLVVAGLLLLGAAGAWLALRPKPAPVTPAASGGAPRPVAALALAPERSVITVGETAELRPTVRDDRGAAVEGAVVTWATRDAAVATVDSLGRVTARGKGATQVTATAGGVTASALVEVTDRVLVPASLAVRAPAETLATGSVMQLAADVRDSSGRSLAARAVRWRSRTAAVATVDPVRGLVTAGRTPGVVFIVAELGQGPRDSTRLVVVAPREVPAPAVPTPAPPVASSAGAPSAPVTSPAPASPPPPAPTDAAPTADASAFQPLRLAAGATATCVVGRAGDARCWGRGNGAAGRVSGIEFDTVVVGGAHACGLTPDGRAYCWGANQYGQLGDGTTNEQLRPVPVKTTERFSAISAGEGHTCALAAGSGLAWCWGLNKSEQLGQGDNTSNRKQPVQVRGSLSFAQVSAGGGHTCALAKNRQIYCWGDGWRYQVGAGAQQLYGEPYRILGDLEFRAIGAGDQHSCALGTDGRVWCWGDDKYGQLGHGKEGDEATEPSLVASDERFKALAVGAKHACALTPAGRAVCWGDGRSGQLGEGPRGVRSKPGAPAAAAAFTAIAAGASHSCGITADRRVLCWGDNAAGQLGDGSTEPRGAPVAARLQ